jgi:hypothetical protein
VVTSRRGCLPAERRDLQTNPLDDPHRAGFNLAVDDGLDSDALLRDDRDDPTRRAAGPIFHHRPDQSHDGRSH